MRQVRSEAGEFIGKVVRVFPQLERTGSGAAGDGGDLDVGPTDVESDGIRLHGDTISLSSKPLEV